MQFASRFRCVSSKHHYTAGKSPCIPLPFVLLGSASAVFINMDSNSNAAGLGNPQTKRDLASTLSTIEAVAASPEQTAHVAGAETTAQATPPELGSFLFFGG